MKPTASFMLKVGKHGKSGSGKGGSLWHIQMGPDEEEEGLEQVNMVVAACRVSSKHYECIPRGSMCGVPCWFHMGNVPPRYTCRSTWLLQHAG